MSERRGYVQPEIVTMSSEELLGHLGPAQGYGYDTSVGRSDVPFDSMPASGQTGGLRRR